MREIYTLSSNDLTKVADWVAYRVTRESIGQSGDREWRADPWLAADETLPPSAYDGASDALHIDRGHQVPLASLSGMPSAADTNVLSNITPQSSALNQGPWVRLEDQERVLAQRLAVPVYVLTGPLFERMMRPLPALSEMHRVPSGYWKVVALADGRATAFVFDQADDRRKDLCSARVWWDDRRPLRSLAGSAGSPKLSGKRLFLAMADEGGTMQDGMKLLRIHLDRLPAKALETRFADHSKDSSHATIYHRAAEEALRWLYPAPPYDPGPTPWFMIEGASPSAGPRR